MPASAFRTLKTLASIVRDSYFCQFLINRRRYPRLSIGPGVYLNVRGPFTHGTAFIGAGSIVQVHPEGSITLGENCFLGRHVEIGPGTISIGADTSLQDRCIILGDVTIGRYGVFAPNVYLSSGTHHFDVHPGWLIKDQDAHLRSQAAAPMPRRPIVVEDDCWIGINAVIMPGVTIGKGCVVGANSVVTRDLPPYSVAVGAPAKVVKKRLEFEPPQSVDYRQPEHWPYFYSGFHLSQAQLAGNASAGGVLTDDRFTLCLASSGKQALHVRARALGDRPFTLKYRDQAYLVRTTVDDLRFMMDATDGDFFSFEVLPAEAGALAIEKAWVE